MRLAVISDIHGNLAALETVLADLEAAGGADHLWVLGDHAAFGPRPAECVRRLQGLVETWGEQRISFISGNTDRYLVTGARPRMKAIDSEEKFAKLLQTRKQQDADFAWCLSQLSFAEYEWLAKLRHHLDLDVPGFGWVVGYHGTPGDDEGMLTPDTPLEEADDALLDREGALGVGGHIHQQMDRQLSRWRVVNVGSVGISFDMPEMAQYGIFSFDGDQVAVDLRAIPYDVDAVVADMQEVGNPAHEWVVRRLREG
ncbi:MAG: metallophosphoesterase [Anaerolineae bacterium]|nr:metallophosphoesterase [Anaerolineae bacterium]